MNIREDVSLEQYSTMQLGGNARYLADINTPEDIVELLSWAKEKNLKTIVIGSGSNIVWDDDGFDGLVLVNKLHGFEIKPHGKQSAYVTIGAGENWDSVVEQCVKAGYSGVEQLSKIPGTAGATLVQNVGAYGREIAEVLVDLQAYDTKTHKLVTLRPSDCHFGYRTSRFKTTDKGRFVIANLTLHLTKTNPKPPFYESLQAYFDEHNITEYTPAIVRAAVTAVRKRKLPDPAEVANNGSFFANPIISKSKFNKLQKKYPEIAHWPVGEQREKIAAGWLVEHAGFKDYHDPETGMATWKYQSLVFVNEKAKSTADLLKFKQKIVDAVREKFDITLEQEPEFVD